MFYFDKINDKKILKSSLLREFEPDFSHIFTTRESVIKSEEKNIKDTAKSNRELILDALGISHESLIEIKQTHSINIKIPKKAGFYDDTDGIILYKPGTATILNFADCTPIILYDPENKVMAGLHAGWRGTAGCISKLGVESMKKNFNSDPKKILAAIGPCIGQDDFECGIEVYEALKSTARGILSHEECFKFKGNKVFCDLAKINAAQLKDCGVKNIDICQFKTYKDNEFLFSYRRENKTTSRISMVIKIA